MDLAFSADLSEWSRFFDGAAQRLQNPAPALERIGDYVAIEVRDNIASGGGDAEWPALKPATLAARARTHPGAVSAPLLVTRELFNSIDKDVHGSDGYVDIGSPLPKAKTLFFGRGAIPARTPFKFRSAVFERIGGIIVNFLLTGRA
jgi:hypothetical protein